MSLTLTLIAALGCGKVPLVWACLNDRDIRQAEVRGLPDVEDIITGRFTRHPALYYEMRIEESLSAIASDPTRLDLYDDVAVAYDRLGKGDEAIEWAERKLERMKTMDLKGDTGHLYRYHANVGTFRVHRWFKQGKDQTRLSEVKRARDHIAKAIEINPRAHFSREKFQLRVLDVLLEPPGMKGGRLPIVIPESDIYANPKEAIEGLSGLIALGNAWESVDVFNALTAGLNAGASPWLAHESYLRAEELARAGKTSIIPGAPVGDALVAALTPADTLDEWTDAQIRLKGRQVYNTLRTSAVEWSKNREAYLVANMSQGKHPDFTPDFWKDYREVVRTQVDMPEREPPHQSASPVSAYVIVFITLNGVFFLRLIWRSRAVLFSKSTTGTARSSSGITGD